MRKLILVMPLALAACDRGVEMKNAKPSEVAAKAATVGPTSKMRPGEWITKTKIDKFDMPGMPPAAQQSMQKASAAREIRVCLTAEDVSKPDAKMMGQADKSCVFDRFAMSDGKMSYTMTCKPQGAGEMHAQVDGSYGPDSYAMTMQSRMTMPGAAQTITMTARVSGERAGECKKPATDRPGA